MIYEGREFEVVVIDPNGIGKGQPTVGFSFTLAEKHVGFPQPTLSGWLERGSGVDCESEIKTLKPPSGNTFRSIEIADDRPGNNPIVMEASDWVALAADVLKTKTKKGKSVISDSTRNKLIDFLAWFAVKGFYADAYAALKGAYTARDSRVLSNWMEVRLSGKRKRNKYTDFLKDKGCESADYAYWTDYVYLKLFKMQAWQMKRFWEVVEGNPDIGRNHIPEIEGLEAVAYCENMVEQVFFEDLQQAHDTAIELTKRKFPRLS